MLRFHQEIWQLLTSQPLNTERYLQDLDQYEQVSNYSVPERRLWTRLSLLGVEPVIEETLVNQIDEWESHHEMHLPEAVREWYSLQIGLPILYADDSWLPFNISAFEILSDSHRLPGSGAVAFMNEQQFGNVAFLLDGSPDPSVHWTYELGRNGQQDIFLRSLAAPHFSHFIYCHLWDWLVSLQSRFGFHIYDIPVVRGLALEKEYFVPLEHIRAHFEEVHFQGLRRHRFLSRTQHIRMLPNSQDPTMVGSGDFYADDVESLLGLISQIWSDHPPLRRMRPSAFHPESEEILNKLLNA